MRHFASIFNLLFYSKSRKCLFAERCFFRKVSKVKGKKKPRKSEVSKENKVGGDLLSHGIA